MSQREFTEKTLALSGYGLGCCAKWSVFVEGCVFIEDWRNGGVNGV